MAQTACGGLPMSDIEDSPAGGIAGTAGRGGF